MSKETERWLDAVAKAVKEGRAARAVKDGVFMALNLDIEVS